MTKMRNLTAALLIAAIATVAAVADEPSPDEMMQAYMEAAQPGEAHAYLADKAGGVSVNVSVNVAVSVAVGGHEGVIGLFEITKGRRHVETLVPCAQEGE